MKRRWLLLFLFATTIRAQTPAEFEVAPAQFGTVPGFRPAPVIACSRTRCLAAWNDFRAEGDRAAWAAFADGDAFEDGDPGFPIRMQSAESIASDGRDFLLVGYRSDPPRASLIRTDGQVRTFALPRIFDQLPTMDDTRVIWTGQAYAIFVRDVGRRTLSLVALDARGELVAPPRTIVVATSVGAFDAAANDAGDVMLAFDSGTGLAMHQRLLRAAEIAAPSVSATFTERDTFYAEAPRQSVDVASDGINFCRLDVVAGTGFLLQLFERNGQPIGNTATIVKNGEQRSPLLWDGSSYQFTYNEDFADHAFEVRAAGISAAGAIVNDFLVGAPRTSPPTPRLNDRTWRAGAVRGGRIVLAWQEIGPAVQIDAASMQPDGSIDASSRRRLTRGWSDRTRLAAAWQGDHLIVTWSDRTDESRLMLARYDAAGRMTNAPVVLASRPLMTGYSFTFPYVASIDSDGHSAVVAHNVWEGNSPRVSATYVREDGATTALFQSIANEAQVVWSGREYVVFVRAGNRVSAKVVSRDGQLLDARAVMDGPPESYYWTPRFARTGNGFVVVWQQHEECVQPPCAGPESSLYAASFDAELNPIGAPVLMSKDSYALSLAGSDRGALFIWGETDGAHFVRMSRDATLLDSQPRRVDSYSILALVATPYGWRAHASGMMIDFFADGGVHLVPRRDMLPPDVTESLLVPRDTSLLLLARRLPAGNETKATLYARWWPDVSRRRAAAH